MELNVHANMAVPRDAKFLATLEQIKHGRPEFGADFLQRQSRWSDILTGEENSVYVGWIGSMYAGYLLLQKGEYADSFLKQHEHMPDVTPELAVKISTRANVPLEWLMAPSVVSA